MRKSLLTTVLALILALSFTLSEGFSLWFSAHVSLPVSGLVSRISASVSFPIAELLILGGSAILLVLFVLAAIRRKPPKGASLALASILLVYVIIWTPLCQVPAKQSEPYETWRLIALCQKLGEDAASLRDHAEPDTNLPDAARNAVQALGISTKTLGTPKYSKFPKLLQALKIAGFYSPWTGEAIISPNEPDFALPFLATHELAHAAGIAREDEANFAAYQACMSGDEAFQYAGTIYALRYAMDALRAVNLDQWFEIRRSLAQGVRDDFTRIDDLGNETQGTAALSDRAAEVFLKLSGQPAGLSSYTGMVNFLLSDVSLIDQSETLQSEEAVQYIN